MNGRDARLYEQAGLLTQRTVMAHGVTLTTSELRLLADRGTAIAHCPLSNFYFADVPLDVQRCLKAGVKVQHPPPKVAAGSNDKQSGTAYIDIPHVIVYGASFGKNSVCALLSDGLWAVDVEQLLPGMCSETCTIRGALPCQMCTLARAASAMFSRRHAIQVCPS